MGVGSRKSYERVSAFVKKKQKNCDWTPPTVDPPARPPFTCSLLLSHRNKGFSRIEPMEEFFAGMRGGVC